MPVAELKHKIMGLLKAHPLIEVEYFEIVDAENLQSVKSWMEEGQKVGCVAVQIGMVRLIDNINISS
jgi:pantoate--beta-alanine ligase